MKLFVALILLGTTAACVWLVTYDWGAAVQDAVVAKKLICCGESSEVIVAEGIVANQCSGVMVSGNEECPISINEGGGNG